MDKAATCFSRQAHSQFSQYCGSESGADVGVPPEDGRCRFPGLDLQSLLFGLPTGLHTIFAPIFGPLVSLSLSLFVFSTCHIAIYGSLKFHHNSLSHERGSAVQAFEVQAGKAHI